MSETEEDKETLMSHLEDLRSALLKCFISLGIFLPFALYFSPKVLNWLITTMIDGKNISVNYFSPVEVFLIQIKLALLLDVVICFPYIAKQLWNFLLPALYENEKKFVKSTVFISTFLFLCGVGFCIFLILPWIIKFGISFSTDNINAVFGISNIITMSLWLAGAFGIMFQIPIITYALIKSGIISYKSVSEKRKWVVVLLLLAAAVLTPPDIVSQISLFIPTYLLFEAGLFFARKYKNNDEKTE